MPTFRTSAIISLRRFLVLNLFASALGVLVPAAAHAAPSVAAVSAAPGTITTGVSTVVTVTATITDPSVIPTGVNLLRYPTPGPAKILGVLHDDGLAGDVAAGDRIFSLRVTFTESAAATIRLRVSAAFKGVLARVLSDEFTLSAVPRVNRAPVSNAGTDRAVPGIGVPVSLNGSGSIDPDGDALTYAWRFVSLPAGSLAALVGPTTASPSFVPDKKGTYVVELLVRDSALTSPPDTVSIVVANTAPVANAGPDQTATVLATATLDGSASTDVDGDPLTYSWSFLSRPAGSSAVLSNPTMVNPIFTIDVGGTYIVRLIVNDGVVNSTADTVVVSTINSAPVARAGADQSVLAGELVTLDATGSSDVNGDPLTFTWSFVSKPTGSTATLSSPASARPTFVADRPGAYRLRLVVNDGLVNGAPDEVAITTRNSAPVANAGPDQSVFVSQTITLTGVGSTDVDGDPLTYSWSLITTPTGSTAALSSAAAVMPTFVADLPGTYVAQLIVSDGLVTSGPDTVVITTLNSAPVANAGADQSVAAGQVVLLDGTGSFDVDGDPLTVSWSLTTRPAGSTATLSSPTLFTSTFVADRPGTYVAQLIVRDGVLDSAPDTVTIATINTTPLANAGPDQSGIAVGALVTLDGSASSDADGHPLTFVWSLLSKPVGSSATPSSFTAAKPTFTLDLPGEYVAQLIVNDGFVASAPDTVLIRSANRAPLANAGPDQTVPAGTTVTFDGSASADPDGEPITYSWTLTVRPLGSAAAIAGPTSVAPTLIPDIAGTYTVELIVNDGRDDSAPDLVTVTATAINRPPVAANNVYDVAQGGTLNIAAPGVLANDTDPDGNAMTAVLVTTTTNGALTLNADGSFTYVPVAAFSGTDTFQYRASDGVVQSATATVTITVKPRPAAPTVTAPVTAGATSVSGSGAAPGASVQLFVNSAPRGAAAIAAAGGTWTVSGLSPALVAGNVVTARQTVAGVQSNPSLPVTVTSGGTGGGVTIVVGPTGGTAALADGAKVVIPPGALAAPVSISITPIPLPAGAVVPPDSALVGKLYSFEPHGLTFTQPVEITLPYDPALLPSGYLEGAIYIHKLNDAGEFHLVASISDDDEQESPKQGLDPATRRVTLRTDSFSIYSGLGLTRAGFAPTVVSGTKGPITIHRPVGGFRTHRPNILQTWGDPYNKCMKGTAPFSNTLALAGRPGAITGIVIHSTNSGSDKREFDGELLWATQKCNPFFAHYYLNRTGDIYQIVADSTVSLHAGPKNATTVGIELQNNVGEPYDGRMTAALVRLMDYLIDQYGITRPVRDPATGRVTRNKDIDAIVTHVEVAPLKKKDPIGNFMSSVDKVYMNSTADEWPLHTLPLGGGGTVTTPALVDVVVDAMAALDLTKQDTGVINASGGDSFGVFNGGNGGAVTWRLDAATVTARVGSAISTAHTHHNLLAIPNGATVTAAPASEFTDAIIEGTLELTSPLDLRVKGTLYVAPRGRIILRNGLIGQNLQVAVRGLPIVQGLVETAAGDAVIDQAGAKAGNVEVLSASPGLFLVPTIISRGGDADSANVPAGLGVGGTGGNVIVNVGSSRLLLGGGVGENAPRIRSTADPALPSPPMHVGDLLPAPPPFNLGSIGLPRPISGQRVPLRKAAFQAGFVRGILTSGGMGGTGTAFSSETQVGGPGGVGGTVAITAGATGSITFRDVDLITGADVEMVVSDIFLPESGAAFTTRIYAASGSLGGRGTVTGSALAGRGGTGGAAGNISVLGALSPAVSSVTNIGGPEGDGAIVGLNGQRPLLADDPLDYFIGHARQATGGGRNLYRLRLDLSGNALGGSGGIPSGRGSGSPGLAGVSGAGGTISGLPK